MKAWIFKSVLCMAMMSCVMVVCISCNEKPIESNPAKPKAVGTIAIIKFATHPALDEVESSFVNSLNSFLATNDTLNYIHVEQRNANGSTQKAQELAEAVTRPDVKMIVVFGTSAAQAVARTPSDIPVLYAAVSDPIGAGLLPSSRITGIKNVDSNIVHEAISFIRKLKPDTKIIGTIYNPSEQNSVFVQGLIRDACGDAGIKLAARQLSDPTHISSIAENLATDADVIYCANDNAVNLGVASLSAVAIATKKPFVIGELSALSRGPAAAVGVDYTETGKILATMAEQILNGKSVKDIPPEGAPASHIWLNMTTFKAINIELTDDLKKSADKLVEQ